MEVTRYIFQSPYSNQVQIGKPDVVSQKGVDVEGFKPKEATTPPSIQNSNDSQTQNSADSDVSPKIEVNLDMYV